MNERQPTVAVLNRALKDHLAECERVGTSTNRRVGRIEAIMVGVAGAAILQLLAMCAILFQKAYG